MAAANKQRKREAAPVAAPRKQHRTEASVEKRLKKNEPRRNTTKPSAAVMPQSAPKEWSAPTVLQNAVIYVGTYDCATAAFRLRKDSIAPRFATSSHVGSVVSVASCARFFVSSGSDESISVHAVREHASAFVDLGKVLTPCQVNHMCFPEPRFLVCAAENGSILVYKTREWTCAAVIEAHERAVVGIAVHPSGVLTVSVGLDNAVAIVDMVRGVLVARRKLDKSLGTPVSVLFSKSGEHFVVQSQYTVSLFDTVSATEIGRASFKKDPPNEIQAMVIGPEFEARRCHSLIVAVESGALYSVNFEVKAAGNVPEQQQQPEKLSKFEFIPILCPAIASVAIDSTSDPATSAVRRIRAMALPEGSRTLIAASSSGEIRVFDLEASTAALSAVLRCRYETGGRITALTVLRRNASTA